MLAIGLMSGTSLDGIDAALVEIRPRCDGYAIALQRFECIPFQAHLRDELLALLPPNEGSVERLAHLHKKLGEAYARAARTVAESTQPAFVASHGQTVWHDGAANVTLQIGDAFAIREALHATVCYDFRSADTAAGGHGAPLVAHVDALLLRDEREDRIVLNLGGIANVTLLRAGAPVQEAIAFDTGPANMLLDRFVAERTGGAATFDRDGALAAAGRVDEALLAAMLRDEYFAASPPKTTGRERFGSHFLARYAGELARLSTQDGAATLTELSAASIAQSVVQAGFAGARTIVSGGGARNRTLLARLAARLDGARVETTDAMGIPPDAKEAIAFAVLGYETLRGRAGNVPAATGARHPAVLGAIAPYELPALLDAIARESTAS
ncbi:MAG: anhydro-N-acetylmuramic acid kinase [Candidatus Eremiobacteraeota bacterium]|nr:anhydro-N-acetylmuramic acid kinase [Candidatus Eremiobacteraeota bacterium]